MTVFSFHPVKHLTTGEGGMVTTDDSAMSQKRFGVFATTESAAMRSQRQQAGPVVLRDGVIGLQLSPDGYRLRTGIQQLDKLESNLARRREIAAEYVAAFRDIPDCSASACAQM